MNGKALLTKKPTVIYEQFDVLVVPFPFTEASTTKKRPTLVVSSTSNFNTLIDKSVMAMITTTSHAPWPLDTPIIDLKSAGLRADSVVRMKLFTLDNALVVRKIGSLSEKDTNVVKQVLQNLFAFN